MEAYLDWHLIYRTVAELEAVTTQLPAEAIADQYTFIEEPQTIAFLRSANGKGNTLRQRCLEHLRRTVDASITR